MEIIVNRLRSAIDTTFGQMLVDGLFECYTLEDKVREVPGMPVASWKVQDHTAIPSGRYEIVLEDSPKFGENTLTLYRPDRSDFGFDYVRIHSGVTHLHTEGCILVGDTIDPIKRTISGGLARGVLKRLKAKVKAAIDAGDKVFITLNNPVG